ncbi:MULTISPECIES: DUF6292 family protein [unclassified Streptomyces]|uniref:DUF6292 family protein n=1 Tax=unclassified Streptomyces TaxID=2593676 RepID=UPI00364A6BC3
MLLQPPGLSRPEMLPHWPYAQAVDEALTDRGIPPGTVRVERSYPMHGDRMYIALIWDVSRCAGLGGICLTWHEETGWAHALLRLSAANAIPLGPLTALHRVFAAPKDVAAVADSLVSRRYPLGRYEGEHHEEWDGALAVRATIDAFHRGAAG